MRLHLRRYVLAVFFVFSTTFAAAGGIEPTLDIESDGTRHVILLEHDDCAVKIVAVDGKMAMISIDSGEKFRFVVSRNPADGAVDIFPIARVKRVVNGKEIDHLAVGKKLQPGLATAEMRSAGIKGLKIFSAEADQVGKVLLYSGTVSSATNLCFEMW